MIFCANDLNSFHIIVLLASIGLNIDKTSCPTGIYLLKVNNGIIRTKMKICSKLAIKTRERCQ